MDHPAIALTVQMHTASRLLKRRFEERTRDRELTSAQWRVLVILRRLGAMRQARLAEMLEIEPISVSRMIDRMEQSGWVERLPDPEDRRARLVQPTPRALGSLANLGAVSDVVQAEALAGFTAAETASLTALLDRLIGNLAAAEDGCAPPASGGAPPEAQPSTAAKSAIPYSDRLMLTGSAR